MTSRERAARAISKWTPAQPFHNVVTYVEHAIDEAVREEREACATVAVVEAERCDVHAKSGGADAGGWVSRRAGARAIADEIRVRAQS